MNTPLEPGSDSPTACRVLIADADAERYVDRLEERFPQVEFTIASEPSSLTRALAQAHPQVVYSCKSSRMPGPTHRALVQDAGVRWIQVGGAGFEHLQPIDRDDLTITNSSGVLSEFMAETVLGAMLMLNFGFDRYVEHKRERRWDPLPWTPLAGKRVLIIGLGSIGQAVARHCRHLGMHVTGLRRRAGRVEGIDRIIDSSQLSLELGETDVLCLHVPLTEHTRGLIANDEFAAMKPGIRIVNTSRGGVMDEHALLRALDDGTVAGAHLDVFATEPLPDDDPLWCAPNLVITPHWADSVSDYTERFAAFFADNLERWLAGESVKNTVDPAAGY